MLDGYGWLLEDQTSRLPKVNKFLEKVPEYQVGRKKAIKGFDDRNMQTLPRFQQKIDTIHEQVIRGELKSVKRMLDKRGWVQVRYIMHFYACTFLNTEILN